MQPAAIRTVYVGGPWDGLILDQPGVEGMVGRYVQFPYSEWTLCLLRGERPDDGAPARPRQMSIYRYDDRVEGEQLFCRFAASFPIADWLAHCAQRHAEGRDPYP